LLWVYGSIVNFNTQVGQNDILQQLQKFSRAHYLILLSISGKIHEFIIHAMRQRARADNLTIIVKFVK